MIWGCAVRNRIEIKKNDNKHEKSHLLSFFLAHRTFFKDILELPDNTLQTPYFITCIYNDPNKQIVFILYTFAYIIRFVHLEFMFLMSSIKKVTLLELYKRRFMNLLN